MQEGERKQGGRRDGLRRRSWAGSHFPLTPSGGGSRQREKKIENVKKVLKWDCCKGGARIWRKSREIGYWRRWCKWWNEETRKWAGKYANTRKITCPFVSEREREREREREKLQNENSWIDIGGRGRPWRKGKVPVSLRLNFCWYFDGWK